MKKRLLSMFLCVAMVTTLVVGCGKKVETTVDAPADATVAQEGDTTTATVPVGEIEDGATLVYWSMWGDTEPQGMLIQEAIDDFTDKTGVEVEVQYGARETRKTLQPALDAGETVDIFDEDVERVNSTWSNYLLDLTPMITAAGMDKSLNGTLMNLTKELGGGVYKSVPYQPSTFVVMYNKTLFEEAGIKEVPTTWDEFNAACEAIKVAGKLPLTVDDAYMGCLFGYIMTRTVGVEATATVVEANKFDEPAVLETAKAIEDLVKKGYIDPRAAGNVWPEGQKTIATGEVAMYLNGTWLPNEIKDLTGPDFKWGSFALPGPIAEGGAGPEANNFGTQCFAINKDTAYPNAAFAFVQHLTTGEWDQKLADASLGVPVANDAVWPAQIAEAKIAIDNTTVRIPWAAGMENDVDNHAKIKAGLASLIKGDIDAQGFADGFK